MGAPIGNKNAAGPHGHPSTMGGTNAGQKKASTKDQNRLKAPFNKDDPSVPKEVRAAFEQRKRLKAAGPYMKTVWK